MDAEVIAAFALRGLAGVKPRENVLTFGAWCQRGRVVRKGEKAVRVGRYNLFHESQTKPLEDGGQKTEGKGLTPEPPRDYRLVLAPGERIRALVRLGDAWALALTFGEHEETEARQWVQSVGGTLIEQSIPIPPDEEPEVTAHCGPAIAEMIDPNGSLRKAGLLTVTEPDPAFAAAETFEVPVQVLPMLQPPAPVLPTNIVVLPPPATPPSSWRNRLRRF